MPTKLTNSERELARLALRREDSLLKQLKKIYRNAFTGVKQVVQQMLGIKLPTQSQIYQLKYQKQLAKNLQQALKPLKSSNLSTFEEYLKESYSNGYIGTLYNMQKQGVPLLLPMDKRQMLKAVSRTNDDIKLSTKLYKDVDKLADTVRHEITRGIAVGASYEDIARNVSYRGNVSLNNAMRIARTEGGRIASEATLEAMHDAKAKGVDVVKVWCSTLDGKTRESHQLLDGVIKELDEEFVTIDGKRAMYPQGFNDPSEDCNCRCTLLQRPRSALGKQNTRYNNDTGEVIECKDYAAFKEKYLQKMEESTIIENIKNNSIIKCKDFNSLEKYLQDKYNVKMDEKVKELYFIPVQQSLEGVEKMLEEFPEAQQFLKEITVDKGGVMSMGYHGRLSFNSVVYKREDGVGFTSERGWSPANCGNFQVGVHEMGHLLERTLIEKNYIGCSIYEKAKAWNNCTEAKKIIAEACKNIKKSSGREFTFQKIQAQVSEYALTNKSECLAECVADYMSNGKQAAPLSQEVWKILKGVFK